jgi:hypothetical protein
MKNVPLRFFVVTFLWSWIIWLPFVLGRTARFWLQGILVLIAGIFFMLYLIRKTKATVQSR